MHNDVRLLADRRVVEIVLRGVAVQSEIAATTDDALDLLARHRLTGYLVDARDLTAGGSAFDVLAQVQALTDADPPLRHRLAVVLPAQAAAADQVGFFETAARNRGLDVRLFGDRDEALAWLAG